MRSYIRHPSDIPIEFCQEPVSAIETRKLHDVSRGGLSFSADMPLEAGAVIRVRISHVEPAFEAPCRVSWCRRHRGDYLIGVAFLDAQDEYRARMVEQVCHIEHYKKEVLEREGRMLSGEQAAREWIHKYAQDFPVPGDMSVEK
ncbi:MAG TPA: PilZ domain-containing protein [Gammaproteobacteria bacterium]